MNKIIPLDEKEIDFMVSQNAIPSRKHLGGHNPYVFTEQGVAMLATVLNSERAIQVNIAIMRAFVKLRGILSTHKELAYKLKDLESKIEKHDEEIHTIFEAIRLLMAPPEKYFGVSTVVFDLLTFSLPRLLSSPTL